MKTITRSDVAEKINEEIGISRKDAEEILDMTIDEISHELASGQDVKLATFGTLSLHHKKPRIGRNPKTGVEATISERTVVTFKASKFLNKAVNK